MKFLRRGKEKSHQTDASVSFTAVDKVTQTYELLEQILENLDPPSLRQAQLVRKSWHDIVHASSTMEAKLHVFQGRYIRGYHVVLIGMDDMGTESLIRSLIFGQPDVLAAYDPFWLPEFQKQLTVDKDTFLLYGTYGQKLAASNKSTAGYLGHVLANSNAFVLLYSVDSRESFDRVKAWVSSLRSDKEPLSLLVQRPKAGRKTSITSSQATLGRCIPAAVVSTKNDVPIAERAVAASEGIALARELGCTFAETSARTGQGVQRAFEEMCRAYKRQRMVEIARRRPRRGSSFMGALGAQRPTSPERKEKFWSWYGKKRQPT